jgi:hypothetical protein
MLELLEAGRRQVTREDEIVRDAGSPEGRRDLLLHANAGLRVDGSANEKIDIRMEGEASGRE